MQPSSIRSLLHDDFSVYVERAHHRARVGAVLPGSIERTANGVEFQRDRSFRALGQRSRPFALREIDYCAVRTFEEQGRLDDHFVDVVAMEKLVKPLVLFVCKHNTGRSQMAEAFLRRFVGDEVEVASAGTIAADRPDPGVVAAMADMGMDISNARPKLIDPGVMARADRIITMGCDVEGVPRVDADWGLPDPKGQSPERVREIRDIVCSKAGELAKELLRPIS